MTGGDEVPSGGRVSGGGAGGGDGPSVEPGIFARRASSFGASAREYAEHRPDYPADGVAWALAGCDHPVADVLDLAAGTGALTGVIARVAGPGAAVTAVEPDPGMRAVLAGRLPGVVALAGSAERIPLPGGSMDAVLVGQAFHWFDAGAALSEIARVLRRGGVLGLLWNTADRSVGWVDRLAETARSSASGLPSAGSDDLPRHRSFEPFAERWFAHSHRRTAESLTATIGTYSHTLVIPAEERAAVLARVRSHLDATPETSSGSFEFPMRTQVARARKRQVGR